MKKILFSILCAFMVSTMASAQYLNVKLDDGTYHSYKTTPNMEVSFGEKKGAEVTESEQTATINGHAYVELAGLKWATENVTFIKSGKSETLYDPIYGFYYTQANDCARQAAESWGGTWKLPTETQWKALMDENNCTWTWKDNYSFNGKNMNGYIVSDKSDSSKFIFLPAAGIYYDGEGDVGGQGIDGYYWSSDNGRYLCFYDGDRSVDINFPYLGMAVRPVSK